MKEYKGKSAQSYAQAESKLMILFPALDKLIPSISKGSFLDVGCGIGDFSERVINKGYEYCGIDVSSEMISRAKNKYPGLDFRILDSTSFSQSFNIKFDVILISMVFISMKSKEDIFKTLYECKRVLKKDGIIIIGDAYPAFDPYMQKYLFNREDIETDFKGYYKSGQLFVALKKMPGGIFKFYDHHWTFRNYFDSVTKSGLKLEMIDECEPLEKYRHIDPKYYDKKRFYPTFMILVCKK